MATVLERTVLHNIIPMVLPFLGQYVGQTSVRDRTVSSFRDGVLFLRRRNGDKYDRNVFTLNEDEVRMLLEGFHTFPLRFMFYYELQPDSDNKIASAQLVDLDMLYRAVRGGLAQLPSKVHRNRDGSQYREFGEDYAAAVVARFPLDSVSVPLAPPEPLLKGLKHAVDRAVVMTLFLDGGWHTAPEIAQLPFAYKMSLEDFFDQQRDSFTSIMSRVRAHPHIVSRHRPKPRGEGRGRSEFRYAQ